MFGLVLGYMAFPAAAQAPSPRAGTGARPAALYLEARLLADRGQSVEAERALARLPLSALPAPVRADVRARRAKLLELVGRCAELTDLLEGQRDGWARALVAQCALKEGDLSVADRLLTSLSKRNGSGVDAFAVRFALAEAKARAGDRDQATRLLRALLVERPDHPEAEQVERLLDAAGTPFVPTFEERLRRAERWNEVRRHDRALRELDVTAVPPGRAFRAKWFHVRGMTLYRTRRHYAEAARVLGRAARLGGPYAVDDAFHAARALSRADRDRQAIAAYRRLVRRHPRHARAAQAEYLAAWLELHHGRRVGERSMRRFLAGPRARQHPRRAREARWQLALRAYERHEWRRAENGFLGYAGEGRDPMWQGRGHYWAARAEERAGDVRSARASYERVLAMAPLHYYGILAARRLEDLGVPVSSPFGEPPADPPPPPAPLPLPAAARFYASLGLHADAVRLLRAHESRIPDTDLPRLVARYHALDEAARPYHLVMARHLGALDRAPTGRRRWVWDAAYPRPFREWVERAAAQHGPSAPLLYAIMRQESGYDPSVVSYADAIGLLQLLPKTAERLGAAAGVQITREQLFDPRWNIRLGAAHVREYLERFEGCVPLAIAAFNAGPHAVVRWLEERGSTDLDLFVENIPYDQTRNYVRRVLSHRARYLYLSAPKSEAYRRLPRAVTRSGCRDGSG